MQQFWALKRRKLLVQFVCVCAVPAACQVVLLCYICLLGEYASVCLPPCNSVYWFVSLFCLRVGPLVYRFSSLFCCSCGFEPVLVALLSTARPLSSCPPPAAPSPSLPPTLRLPVSQLIRQSVSVFECGYQWRQMCCVRLIDDCLFLPQGLIQNQVRWLLKDFNYRGNPHQTCEHTCGLTHKPSVGLRDKVLVVDI